MSYVAEDVGDRKKPGATAMARTCVEVSGVSSTSGWAEGDAGVGSEPSTV